MTKIFLVPHFKKDSWSFSRSRETSKLIPANLLREIDDKQFALDLNELFQFLHEIELEYEKTIRFFHLEDINGKRASITYYLGGTIINEYSLKKLVPGYIMWTKYSEPEELWVYHSKNEVYGFRPGSRILDWHD